MIPPFLDCEIEADESYFGGHRKGKRGRGAAGKVPVFGLLKRGGKVYTQVILDSKTDTLMPIIREKVKPDSIIYTDTFRSYNAPDVSEFKHYRINHSQIFADKHNHINGIAKHKFNLFLKECEFRFNYGSPKEQLKILKNRKLIKHLGQPQN